jgi:hypothetical protein
MFAKQAPIDQWRQILATLRGNSKLCWTGGGHRGHCAVILGNASTRSAHLRKKKEQGAKPCSKIVSALFFPQV